MHRRRVVARADSGMVPVAAVFRPNPGQARKAEGRQMSKTVILSTARTPFGKMGGALSTLDATDLGGRRSRRRWSAPRSIPEQVEQVIFGQVLQAGQGQIPSRQAQIKGGIPKEVPSETINKVCASGMRTIGLADQAIRAGDLRSASTGGMESMSNAPYLLPGARFGFRMGDVKAVDSMTHDGLTNPFTEQADDQRGQRGRQRARDHPPRPRPLGRALAPARRQATDEGRLAEEIVSVTVKSRKAENVVEADEAIRPDTTLETLAKLKAVGGDDATHTAGNSPGVNDGAAAVVVASDEWAKRTASGSPPPSSPTAGRRRLPLPREDARPRPPSRRSRRSARTPTRSTSGRSTRRSPRSP